MSSSQSTKRSAPFLEKLLDGAEVECKTLGDETFIEVANRGRKPVKASLRQPGKTPYYVSAVNGSSLSSARASLHVGKYLLSRETIRSL
ncbi:MAG: hypothetical protein JXR95_13370 [Deltaproteobacteria bacterium]|nr:hypothetical protein [Deltaproteobacteria bacterium]